MILRRSGLRHVDATLSCAGDGTFFVPFIFSVCTDRVPDGTANAATRSLVSGEGAQPARRRTALSRPGEGDRKGRCPFLSIGQPRVPRARRGAAFQRPSSPESADAARAAAGSSRRTIEGTGEGNHVVPSIFPTGCSHVLVPRRWPPPRSFHDAKSRWKRELTPGRSCSLANHKTLPRGREEITTALAVDGAATRRGLR